MPLRYNQALGIVRQRGFRDRRGRPIRSYRAYVNGMMRRGQGRAGGLGGRRFYGRRRYYRRW